MIPAGHLVVGGGGVTADPGIDLGSQTWLHSVFACPLHGDVSLGMRDFASGADLVQSGITVPGSADAQKKVSRARPCLLRLLRQWYEVVWRLRRAGFTLRGSFSCDNFLVYRPKQHEPRKRRRSQIMQKRVHPPAPAEDKIEVRMTGRLHLSVFSIEDAVEDDRSFVWSVREVLHIRHRGHIPLEIEDWLDLVNSRGVGHEYLIRYHISLMLPRAALSVLLALRRRIEYLMRRQPDVFKTLLYMAAPCNDWNSRILSFSNALMEAARLHVLNQNGKPQEKGFQPNVRGVLKVIRNCSEHPAKKLQDYMMLILEEDLCAFAAFLYWVMFRAGQLPFLHLETTMG